MKQYRVTVEQTFKKSCSFLVTAENEDFAKDKAEELSKYEPFSNEAYLTDVYAKDAEEILA